MDTGKALSFCLSIKSLDFSIEVPFSHVNYRNDGNSFRATFESNSLSVRFDCWSEFRRFVFQINHKDRTYGGNLSFNYVEEETEGDQETEIIDAMWELQKSLFFNRPVDIFPEFYYF
jgi:hypothetical protein